MSPQWHVKDPGHSAKGAVGRLHLNTRTPFTQRSQNGLTMPLFRLSVGTYQETSSHATHQLAEPLWTDPGLKSAINVHELISTLKKKCMRGNEWSNTLPKSWLARKKQQQCNTTIRNTRCTLYFPGGGGRYIMKSRMLYDNPCKTRQFFLRLGTVDAEIKVYPCS